MARIIRRHRQNKIRRIFTPEKIKRTIGSYCSCVKECNKRNKENIGSIAQVNFFCYG